MFPVKEIQALQKMDERGTVDRIELKCLESETWE